jgi:hypothetical protein
MPKWPHTAEHKPIVYSAISWLVGRVVALSLHAICTLPGWVPFPDAVFNKHKWAALSLKPFKLLAHWRSNGVIEVCRS